MTTVTPWYVDCDGVPHKVTEHQPGDINIVDRGTWKEIEILAPPDGEPGREVLETYELHERPWEVVFRERGIHLEP